MPEYTLTIDGPIHYLTVDGVTQNGWQIKQNGRFYIPNIHGLNLEMCGSLGAARRQLIKKWEGNATNEPQ